MIPGDAYPNLQESELHPTPRLDMPERLFSILRIRMWILGCSRCWDCLKRGAGIRMSPVRGVTG